MSMKTFLITILCGLLLNTAFADSVDVHAIVPEVHLKDGRVLQNVKFVSYSSTAVMARWDGGRGTISYKLLPDDFQEAMKEHIPQPPTPTPTEAPISDCIPAETDPPPGPSATINGQVFIATKGGENIKLGLVEVSVYPLGVFDSYRKQAYVIYLAKQKRLKEKEKVLEAARNYTEGMRVFDAESALSFDKWDFLPPATASTKTDADGKFSVTHNVASPVIFARARRSVGKETEYYVWVIFKREITPTLFLTNDNLTENVSY